VQQQNSARGILSGQLEAAIPVSLPATRVGSAAGAVADQRVGWPGADLVVDLLLEVREQLVLHLQIVREGDDLPSTQGLELHLQVFCVPGLQARTATDLENVESKDTDNETEHCYSQEQADSFH